ANFDLAASTTRLAFSIAVDPFLSAVAMSRKIAANLCRSGRGGRGRPGLDPLQQHVHITSIMSKTKMPNRINTTTPSNRGTKVSPSPRDGSTGNGAGTSGLK